MNREEILLVAKQSGVRLASYSDTVDHRNVYPHELERFAKLVAAHEREACAKACEELLSAVSTGDEHMDGVADCLDTIRARGEK